MAHHVTAPSMDQIPEGATAPNAAATRQVIAWRRRALDQQLPALSFPANVGAPSLVFLAAIAALAIVATLVFAIHGRPAVPQAIVDSQQDLISRLARSLNTAYGTSVEHIERVVEGYHQSAQPNDDRVLSAVVRADLPWTGGAIVETASRRILTATGAAVPIDLLPTPLPQDGTVAVMTDDGPALILAVPLDDTRTLEALQPILMRNLRLNPEASHGVFAVAPDGQYTLMQGVTAVTAETLPAAFAGLTSIQSNVAKALPVKGSSSRQLVVSAARIGTTGLVVASLIVADVEEGVSLLQGTILGLSLFAVALASFAVMRRSLVRPVRHLLREAKAYACGDDKAGRRRPRGKEVVRIATALAVSSGGVVQGRRLQSTALTGLALATLLVAAWSGVVVMASIRTATPTMPAQLVRDEESRAEAASAALGNALATGLDAVSEIVSAEPSPDPSSIQKTLRREFAADRAFRSLYLVDSSGAHLAITGRRPLREPGPVPGEIGIRLQAAQGRLPVIYAYRLASNGYATVGEFELDTLRRVLRQVDGRARVVDADMQTVLDSEGYLAFEPLQGDALRAAAIETLPGGTVGVAKIEKNASTLIASSGLRSPPSVAHLEWSIVIQRNVSALGLPRVFAQRWSLLMAGIAVAFALLVLAWHYLIFVRPLRRLATAADTITRGNVELPVSPQRHDEIGAVAICLEICRQVSHTGSARFGGAVRLRGSEADFTTVLPRVPRQAVRHAKGRNENKDSAAERLTPGT